MCSGIVKKICNCKFATVGQVTALFNKDTVDQDIRWRFCHSIRAFVLPSVCPFLHWSGGPSGISQKLQIQVNSSEFRKNSRKFVTFSNCWLGAGPVQQGCAVYQ